MDNRQPPIQRTLPVRTVVAAFVQMMGILLGGAVAVVAWGVLGGLAWLAVVLYLVGDELTPDEEQVPDGKG